MVIAVHDMVCLTIQMDVFRLRVNQMIRRIFLGMLGEDLSRDLEKGINKDMPIFFLGSENY